MTRSGYLFAKLLKLLGFPFTKYRLQNATSELRLLRESEMILGFYVWENAKDLEHFAEEAAIIRSILEHKENLSNEIQSWKDRVAKASHASKRSESLPQSSRQQLITKHHNIASRADSIINKSEQIIEEAKQVRQQYNQKASHIKDLSTSGAKAHLIEQEKEKLEALKQRFNRLKAAREKNEQTLVVYSEKLRELEGQIEQESQNSETNPATEKYHTIGQANQKIAKLQLQAANIDNDLQNHYALIGKKISKEYFIDRNCRRAIKEKATLIRIMAALRKSIEYNHHIAGR